MSARLTRFQVSIFALLLIINTNFFAAEVNPDTSPQWIAHASSPGPDYPVVGHSLFDQLFRQNQKGSQEYRVPYPFEALITSIENRIDNGKKPSVPHTLIPIGRSLQREAAAPDYFQFPRSIITLAGEPVTTPGEAATVMKYRLFIAYQEKSNLLEVISYNEAAARFEFQLVENYRSDAEPRVSQANRTLCMSCHQNGGPIFAASPWNESNFNPEVAIKLTNTQPTKYESLITAISDDAQVIDLATSRANYLAAAQLIWQTGCEGPDRIKNFRCRAAILQALLQFRLSADTAFDTASSAYQSDFVASLKNNWRVHWPGGLLLASAQIPDINPFQASKFKADRNPLFPRSPHAFWERPDETFSKGVIYRIAGFLTEADIQRLDQQLLKLASSNNIESSHYQASCTMATSPTNKSATEFAFDCGNLSLTRPIKATIGIEYENNEITDLRILSLSLSENSLIWQPTISKYTISNANNSSQLYANLSGASGKLSARLENGNRIDAMILSLSQDTANNGLPETLVLELIVSDDFKIMQQAIEQMVAEGLAGRSKALSSLPFSQRAIIADLEKLLDMETFNWCCEFESIDQKNVALNPTKIEHQGETAPFFRYCASCHSGSTNLPPGFLRGDTQQVTRQLRQCAPRILRRLTASRSGVDADRISPMPPRASLDNNQSDGTDWQSSEAFRQLTTTIRDLLRSRGETYLTEVINSEYRNLQPCLK